MRTRTEQDVRLFNDAIDKCTRPVWLASPDGKNYNMKSVEEHYTGMAKWIDDMNDEMEIFTCSYEDEAVMMSFLLQLRTA